MTKYSIVLLPLLLAMGKLKSQDLKTDTTKIKELKELKIESRTNGNKVDRLDPVRKERLGQTELKKNACCNLAESFESNPTVEVSFSNAVTGARQIQMLGLSGIYVQMLTDVLPTVRGLNYTYGFNNIPGAMVHSIYINKGPGSVTNGFESMTGQINVELMKPENAPRLFINGYMSNMLRSELNINAAHKLNSKWSTMLMAHGSTLQNKVDMNKDGYLDQPLYTQLSGVQRWKYSGEHVEAMFGVKGLYDVKHGGQAVFNKFLPKEEQQAWGFGMDTKRWEAFLKSSYNFDDCGAKSLGIQLNASSHKLNGFYGRQNYHGHQNSLYANLIYQTFIDEEQHELRTGASLQYDDIQENFKGLDLHRHEPVAGVFAEYTNRESEVWSLLLGVRGDYNFRLKKYYFIPRANVKYSFSKNASVRASAGSGFRTPNVFAENSQVFTSNRKIFLASNIMPEYSWNYGLNFSYCYKQSGKEGRLSLDLFKTDFRNQLVADFDQSPQEAHFYNLKGQSYAWYFQAEWYYEVFKNFDIRLAYKFNDVKVTQQGILVEKILNARHRALVNLAYTTPNKNWKFDFTTQWIGKQRLPDLSKNPEQYRLVEYSPRYVRMLGQITYVRKQMEYYMGSENIGNFMQQNLIVDANNPFGNYFDASNIWGPTLGRMIYAGFRFTLQ